MLRSVLIVGSCIADVTLALHESATPETSMLFAGIALTGAFTGCVSMACAISRRLTGLELPAKRAV